MLVVTHPKLQYSLQSHQPTRRTFYPSHATLVRSGECYHLVKDQLLETLSAHDAATYA